MKKRKRIFNWDYSNLSMAQPIMEKVLKHLGYRMIDEDSQGFDMRFSIKKITKKKK